MQTDFPAVHLSGDQQSAHAESRLLRRHGSESVPVLRHHPCRLVRGEVRAFRRQRQAGFQFDNFASLLLTISFGFAMVNYYSTPIPGIGTSFHNLVTNEAQFLTNQINQNAAANRCQAGRRLRIPHGLPRMWRDFLGTAIYVVVTILLAAAQAIAIVVIAYGFIATAVCVLWGRSSYRSLSSRRLEWLFWGWFRCFIQYAFYQVVASAVVYVIGNLMLGALRLPPGGHPFHRRTHRLVSRPIHHLSRFDLCASESSLLTNHIFSGTPGGSSAGLWKRPLRSWTGFLMSNDASFHDAKRLYLEQYGDPMVTNTYLKIALVLVSLVAIGLALVDLRTIRTFQNFRPLVIRIDDLGRAEAINYHNFEYKPQDAEAKYFLSQFCALYYRRNRYTIQDDFSKSLYFLDSKLADGILDAYKKDDIIKKFLTNTAVPEIDIDVKKVALEDMQSPAVQGPRGLLHGLLLARRP